MAGIAPPDVKQYFYSRSCMDSTAVLACTYARFCSTEEENLITATPGQLHVYVVRTTGSTSHLFLRASLRVDGETTDLCAIRRSNGADHIAACFKPAKLAILQWDSEARDISVISLRSFEETSTIGRAWIPWHVPGTDGRSELGDGPKLISHAGSGSISMVCLSSSIETMVFPDIDLDGDGNESILDADIGHGHYNSVASADQTGLGMESDDVPESLQMSANLGDTRSLNLQKQMLQMGEGQSGMVSGEGADDSMQTVSTLLTDHRIALPIDAAYVGGSTLPVVAVLHAIKATHPGLLWQSRDVCEVTALAIDASTNQTNVVWTVQGLPWDCSSIHCLPDAVGGVIVMSPCSVHLLSQTRRLSIAWNDVAVPASLGVFHKHLNRDDFLEGGAKFVPVSDTSFLLVDRLGNMFDLTLLTELDPSRIIDVRISNNCRVAPPSSIAWMPVFKHRSDSPTMPTMHSDADRQVSSVSTGRLVFFGSYVSSSCLVLCSVGTGHGDDMDVDLSCPEGFVSGIDDPPPLPPTSSSAAAASTLSAKFESVVKEEDKMQFSEAQNKSSLQHFFGNNEMQACQFSSEEDLEILAAYKEHGGSPGEWPGSVICKSCEVVQNHGAIRGTSTAKAFTPCWEDGDVKYDAGAELAAATSQGVHGSLLLAKRSLVLEIRKRMKAGSLLSKGAHKLFLLRDSTEDEYHSAVVLSTKSRTQLISISEDASKHWFDSSMIVRETSLLVTMLQDSSVLQVTPSRICLHEKGKDVRSIPVGDKDVDGAENTVAVRADSMGPFVVLRTKAGTLKVIEIDADGSGLSNSSVVSLANRVECFGLMRWRPGPDGVVCMAIQSGGHLKAFRLPGGSPLFQSPSATFGAQALSPSMPSLPMANQVRAEVIGAIAEPHGDELNITLAIVNSTGDLLVYQSSQAEGPSWSGLRFNRLSLDTRSVFAAGAEISSSGGASSRQRHIIAVDNFGGNRGLAVSGSGSAFIACRRGRVHVHPLNVPGGDQILYCCPFNSLHYECFHGLFCLTDKSLDMCCMPEGWEITACPWPSKRIMFGRTVYRVSYIPPDEQFKAFGGFFAVLFSSPTSDMPQPHYKAKGRVPIRVLPNDDVFGVALISAVSHEILDYKYLLDREQDALQEPYREHITCMKLVHLRAPAKNGFVPYLALTGGYICGEDNMPKGRIRFFRVSPVVRDESSVDFQLKCVYVSEKDEPWKGAGPFVTKQPCMSIVSCEGYLLTAQGMNPSQTGLCKVYAYRWTGETLVGIAFIDLSLFVTSLEVFKFYIIATDYNQNVKVLRWREETRTLDLIARAADPVSSVSSATFLVHGAQHNLEEKVLSIVSADLKGNVSVASMTAQVPRGQLLPVCDFNNCDVVNTLQRIPIPCLTSGVPDTALLMGSREGSVGCLVAVPPVLRDRLLKLMNVMLREHAPRAGLAVLSFRRPYVLNLPRREMGFHALDGNTLLEYLNMDMHKQSQISRHIGCSREQILADLTFLELVADIPMPIDV